MDPVAFFTAFWAEFLAGFILLVLGSVVIPAYLRFRNRPKLKLRSRVDGKNVFVLTQSQDKSWHTCITLDIQNRGYKTMERFYWEIFLEKDLLSEAPELAIKYADGKEWTHREVVGKYIRIWGYLE